MKTMKTTPMARARSMAVVLEILLVSQLLIGACCVKIIDMKVPEIIQFGGQDSVVLDCNYIMEDTNGLVVKWYFKNKTQVYQWIPTKTPQGLGILRGKLDLNYRVSDDPYKSHRALRIVNPGTELSGEYTCVVSTFLAEDQRTKQMTVFVPERNFRLVQDKQQQDSVKVMCSADGMFPRPNITITTPDSDRLDGISTSITPSGGRFDAVSWVLLRDDILPSPTEFVCELRIPQANYVVKKEAIYYPGRVNLAREPPAAGTRSYGADSAVSQKIFSLLLLLPLMLILS